MPAFFTYLLEVSVCLMVFYGFYALLLQHSQQLTWNRAYLLTALLFSMFIPIMELPHFWENGAHNTLVVWLQTVDISAITSGNSDLTNAPSLSLLFWLNMLYWLGFLWFGGRLIGQLWVFKNRIQQNQWQVLRDYKLSINLQLPTFSFLDFLVFNPKNLSETAQTQILLHEKAHIQQKHTWDILFLELLGVVLWFNPFVYAYKRAIRDVHEYLADQAVLQVYPKQGKHYGALLIQQAVYQQGFTLSNHFSNNQIKKRITMIKRMKTKQVSSPRYRYLLALPLLLCLFVVFACNKGETIIEEKIGENSKIEASLKNTADYMPNEDGVYDMVDKMPEYPGGMEGLFKFIGNNLTYPSKGRKEGIEGTNVVSFIINKDGSVSDVHIVKSINQDFDNASIAIVEKMEKWTPGEQEGKKVRVAYKLPLKYKLE